jgi:hypothetical protein
VIVKVDSRAGRFGQSAPSEVRVLFLAPAAALALAAQAPATTLAASPRAAVSAAPPLEVAGLVATVEVRALAPDLDEGRTAETTALARALETPTTLVTRAWLAQDLSRQEVVSSSALLPAGTLLLHKAGDRAYVLADPRQRTYAVMDGEALLDVVEGTAGVVDTQYEARVRHTDEKRDIAGYPARKSIVTVSYVSAVPFETSEVKVQRKADIEVWHTYGVVSMAAVDHLFFKFQRDKTGAVRDAVAREIGFPLEVKMVVTQGSGPKAAVQPGSVHVLVKELRKDAKLDADLFRIPPAGYRRVERLPFAVPGPAR